MMILKRIVLLVTIVIALIFTSTKANAVDVTCGAIYSTSSDSWIEGGNHEEYDNNLDISKTIKVTGATKLRIVVNGEIEEGGGGNYDWIYVYDKDGNEIYKDDGELDNTPFTVSGDTVTIKLHSDGAVNSEGATIMIDNVGCSFTCNDTFYLTDLTESGTGSTTGTENWFHSINRDKTPYEFTAIGDISAHNYNAMGYNIKDNFIYALDGNNLLKIDNEGTTRDIGVVEGLPTEQLYSAEFGRDGFLYVTRNSASSGTEMYKVDVIEKKVIETINLSFEAKFWDMAIDETGDYFYVMLLNGEKNDKFAKINIHTGEITTIGNTHDDLPSYIGLVFTDVNGQVFMISNDNGFYQVNTTTGVLTLLSSTLGLSDNNDATSCPNAEIHMPKDFGDAPNNYPHVSHTISSSLYLGYKVPDGEDDQQSSTDATADGIDDNDSLGVLETLVAGEDYYSVALRIVNQTEKRAYLTAWIDFNRNGTFEENEGVNSNEIAISSDFFGQIVTMTWDNITDENATAIENATEGKTIMRIRLSTEKIPRDNSGLILSPDGEVEDYEITIVKQTPPATEPFTCNNEGIIFSGNNDNVSNNFSIVDLEDKTFDFKEKFGTRWINAAGYNVQDNFIYGIGFKNDSHKDIDVLKIDKNHNVEKLNVTGLPQGTSMYALGDVDFNNKLYVSTILNEEGHITYLESLIVIDLESRTVENQIPLVFPDDSNMTNIIAADYAFNPKDAMLYTVDFTLNQLVRIDPISGDVELLGDIGNIGYAYSVISFFDLDGNFLFTNNDNTIIYKIDISDPDNIDPKASVYITDLTMPGSGDGSKCAYSYIKVKDFCEDSPSIHWDTQGATETGPFRGELIEGFSSSGGAIIGRVITTQGTNGREDPLYDSSGGTEIDLKSRNSEETKNVTTTVIFSEPITMKEFDVHSVVDLGGYDESQTIKFYLDGERVYFLATVYDPDGGTVTGASYNSFSGEAQGSTESPEASFRFVIDHAIDKIVITQRSDATADDIGFRVTSLYDFEGKCPTPPTPFACEDDTIYLSNRSELGTGEADSGKTWLHTIDRDSNPYSFSAIGSGYTIDSNGYNAMGYNVKDNFIYAMFKSELLRIEADGTVTNLGVVDGYPDNNQRYAGEFGRDGYYYVTNDGGGDKLMLKIDVYKRKVVDTITLNEGGSDAYPVFWDMAIDKSGDYFYMMRLDNNSANYEDNLKVTKINVATGELTSIGKVHSELDSHIEITYSDVNGDIYMQESDSGFYKVNIETGELLKLSSTLSLTDYADGTTCPDANITEPPALLIEDVTAKEGDSNLTNFIFTLRLDRNVTRDVSVDYTLHDGVNAVTPKESAEQSPKDNDYIGATGRITFSAGESTKLVIVSVVGDKKMEYDEEFYLDLDNAEHIYLIDSRAVGTIINDDVAPLNIERPDSLEKYNKDNSLDHKYNLYTQIAKKDFDYTVVAYSEDTANPVEESIENLTVKVELIDGMDSNATTRVLTTSIVTFDNKSRVDIATPTDLTSTKATRYAYYRIYYPVDTNNTVLRDSSCKTVDCLKALPNFKKFQSVNSKDSFSIRPSGFKMILSVDKNGTKKELEVSDSVSTEVVLASGAEYEVEVQALGYTDRVESTYETNVTIDKEEVNATLKFNDSSSCADKNDTSLEYFNFLEGINQKREFKHNNVGKYLVAVNDSNWTTLDYFSDDMKRGCISNSTSNELDADGKYGCDIGTIFTNINNKNYEELKVAFEPYSFNMNMSVHNSQGNKEYLYMSNLNRSDQMALVLEGTIMATSKDGKITDNFTDTCAAKKMTFGLDYLAESSEGNFTEDFNLSTTDGTPVDIQRMIRHNRGAYSVVDDKALDKNITILASHFEDDAPVKGSSELSVLYNIEKHLSETINPVRLHLNIAKVSSSEAKSITSESDDFMPEGEDNMSAVKLFYFSKIAPDEEEYPATEDNNYTTPITIFIFCDHNSTWCTSMIRANGLNSVIPGWYTAITHDSGFEGRVLSFNSVLAKVTPDADHLPNFNENSGRIENLVTTFNGTGLNITTKVEVVPDEWHKYHRDVAQNGLPFWLNTFNQNFGQISGVGKSGKMLSIQGNMVDSKRIDW